MDNQTAHPFYLFSCPYGIAGATPYTSAAPLFIQNSTYFHDLIKQSDIAFSWQSVLVSAQFTALDKYAQVNLICTELAQQVSACARQNIPFCVIGGDHSNAIGTWSGLYDVYRDQGDLGLLWIDAHMDSHTPETTPSGNIHGMPLAALLGYGHPHLVNILNAGAKFKPQHVFLIGIRSYESGEHDLLKRLGVRIYYIEEIEARGFNIIMLEVLTHLKANTIGFGVSIDVDAIDPEEAPGVDVPEPHGIHARDLLQFLENYAKDKNWLGTEIVEFNPNKDKNNLTEKLVVDMLQKLHQAKLGLQHDR